MTEAKISRPYPHPPIPPLVRRAGVNADPMTLADVLTMTSLPSFAYGAMAERQRTDAAFYSAAATNALYSDADRASYRQLADAHFALADRADRLARSWDAYHQGLEAEVRAMERGR